MLVRYECQEIRLSRPSLAVSPWLSEFFHFQPSCNPEGLPIDSMRTVRSVARIPRSGPNAAAPAGTLGFYARCAARSASEPRPMMDYYEELGIDRSASPEEIRQAYKHLVRLLHPDHCH